MSAKETKSSKNTKTTAVRSKLKSKPTGVPRKLTTTEAKPGTIRREENSRVNSDPTDLDSSAKPKNDRKLESKERKGTADRTLERIQLQRQELNLLEKRRMARKEEEFKKKLGELAKENEQLKATEGLLTKENEVVRNDRDYKDLELEKLTQFWTIASSQLERQRQESIDLEARMQRVKLAHVERMSLLHKRISMLQLDTRLERESGTQTDPFGEDSKCTGHVDVLVQTESDWDRQKVNDILKQHDEELVAFIAEIENAKQQAQSDYKFAVVQMEQRLREEHEEELRAIREEKERQLEEMVRVQCEQVQLIKIDRMHLKAELTGIITDQKVEIQELNGSLASKEEERAKLSNNLQTTKQEHEDLNEQYRALSSIYEKNKVDAKTLKADVKTIGDLRTRLEKIEDINEILLGEYKKLETERNLVAEQLAYLLKAGVQQIRDSKNNPVSMASLSEHKKSHEIGMQLDEIRRKYKN